MAWLKRAVIFIAASLAAWPAAAQHSDDGGRFALHTFLYHSPDFGVQVEYLHSDGSAYLWFPNEARIIRGAWRVTKAGEICFAYRREPAGLIFARSVGRWDCRSADQQVLRIFAKCSDDPFNLRSGRAPFILRSNDYFPTFKAIEKAHQSGRR